MRISLVTGITVGVETCLVGVFYESVAVPVICQGHEANAVFDDLVGDLVAPGRYHLDAAGVDPFEVDHHRVRLVELDSYPDGGIAVDLLLGPADTVHGFGNPRIEGVEDDRPDAQPVDRGLAANREEDRVLVGLAARGESGEGRQSDEEREGKSKNRS